MEKDRVARIKAILARVSNPKESEGEVRARIRGIVEGSEHVCPRCGFPGFTGGLHPFAGHSGQTKSQTAWCTGAASLDRKDAPPVHEWACKHCPKHWMYSQTEMEIADSDGRCHECAEKFLTRED